MDFSGKYLPVHLKPKKDELLSSWMVRLSRANGYILHTFSSVLFPGKCLWNRDIDNSFDHSIITILANKTGICANKCFSTTLKSFEGIIFEKHFANRTTPWIMAVDVYHRLRKKYGLQFCPDCLSEEEPYFRKSWRLALTTLCPIHRRYLHDKCPYCKEPINFHRLDFSTGPISLCYNCKKNLSKIATTEDSVEELDLSIQRDIIITLERGWKEIKSNQIVYSHLFFKVYHQLCKTILRCHKQNKWLGVINESGLSINPKDFANIRTVEDLPVMSRVSLYRIIHWLLEEWPERFLNVCIKNKIYRSILEKDFKESPFWYGSMIEQHLYRPNYIRSEEEVMSAINYLKARNCVLSEKRISKTLGASEVLKSRPHIKNILEFN